MSARVKTIIINETLADAVRGYVMFEDEAERRFWAGLLAVDEEQTAAVALFDAERRMMVEVGPDWQKGEDGVYRWFSPEGKRGRRRRLLYEVRPHRSGGYQGFKVDTPSPVNLGVTYTAAAMCRGIERDHDLPRSDAA